MSGMEVLRGRINRTRGSLAEVFGEAQCFLAQHVAINGNMFSVHVFRPYT